MSNAEQISKFDPTPLKRPQPQPQPQAPPPLKPLQPVSEAERRRRDEEIAFNY